MEGAARAPSGHPGGAEVEGCEAAGRSHGAAQSAARSSEACCRGAHGNGRTFRGLSLEAQEANRAGGEAKPQWRRRSRACHRRKTVLSQGSYRALAVTLIALGLCQGLGSGVFAQSKIDEYKDGAVGTLPKRCGVDGGSPVFCSRCENTTALWMDDKADPSWITFKQVFGDKETPGDISSKDGQPITYVRGQPFESNQYHYFEFTVSGGDGNRADDVRRDAVYLSLVSPSSIPVSKGAVVIASEDAAKKPAYDFYVGQNCVPQEGAWNNQGYGNVNADEKMKSIHVNVTMDARYFVALQSRKIRYNVAAFDFTMKLSRGSLVSKYGSTRCSPLVYRCRAEMLKGRQRSEVSNNQVGISHDRASFSLALCSHSYEKKGEERAWRQGTGRSKER